MLITKSSGHILRHQGNGAISSENGKKDRKSVKCTKGYKKSIQKVYKNALIMDSTLQCFDACRYASNQAKIFQKFATFFLKIGTFLLFPLEKILPFFKQFSCFFSKLLLNLLFSATIWIIGIFFHL